MLRRGARQRRAVVLAMSAKGKVTPIKVGDVLFHQGEASESVLQVRSGEIEVFREVGAASVLLGRVGAGEWLGEMGIIENRARSATARAIADGEVEVLTANEFLERVSGDPQLARDLILRLSIRLRRIEDKIAGDVVGFQQKGRLKEPTGALPENTILHGSRIFLSAQTEGLRARIGAEPIPVEKSPFVVGRAPVMDEARPLQQPDLVIEDEEPFRLSRQHFMIADSGDHVIVSDVGSRLGTIVNGQPIGHHFAKDSAPLHAGENQVVAGGLDSPFVFSLFCDPAAAGISEPAPRITPPG